MTPNNMPVLKLLRLYVIVSMLMFWSATVAILFLNWKALIKIYYVPIIGIIILFWFFSINKKMKQYEE
jgi:hypothetical protein